MPELTLLQVYTDYLNSLEHEQGCAVTTVRTYHSWLKHFEKWLTDCNEPLTVSSFNQTTLRTFLYQISSRGLRPRTIRSAFHPLRALGEFMVRHGILTENPAKLITMPKKDAAVRLTISTEEIVALLEAVHRLHPPRRKALAQGMLAVLVYTGMRFQELLDLRLADVSLETGVLLVAHGKGDKARQLYPAGPCLAAIADWLNERGECGHDWLWALDRGRRMGDKACRDMLEEIKSVAGLRGHANIKPHSLRHAFATRMMENGASIKVIQSALGHANTQTTYQYLHLEERQAKEMASYALIPQAQPAAPPQPVATKQAAADFRRRRRTPSRDRQG